MKQSKVPKATYFFLLLVVPTAVYFFTTLFSSSPFKYPKYFALQKNEKSDGWVQNVTEDTTNKYEKIESTTQFAITTPKPDTSSAGQKYIINERNLCETGKGKSERILLLLMVPSAAKEFAAREAIRYSYASVSKNNTADVRHFFYFGISKDAQLNVKLREESEAFHDIVQTDMIDTYDNLTLKVISGLTWTTTFCKQAQYVIKLDTDTWLNINKLLPTLSTPAMALKDVVGGTPQRGARPHRDPKDKWYTGVNEYPKDVFPDYCSGPSYIMRTEVAREIVRVSKSVKVIRMEDVYIGMCLQALKYGVTSVPGFCWWRATGDPCKLKKDFVTSHNTSPKEMRDAWDSKCS